MPNQNVKFQKQFTCLWNRSRFEPILAVVAVRVITKIFENIEIQDRATPPLSDFNSNASALGTYSQQKMCSRAATHDTGKGERVLDVALSLSSEERSKTR